MRPFCYSPARPYRETINRKEARTMRRSLSLLLVLAGLGLLTIGRPARSQKVEADPNQVYTVVPEAGTWMVLVATYAVKAIREIKTPPHIVSPSGAEAYDTYLRMKTDAKGRPIPDANGQPTYERLRVNPLSSASVIRNPSLPKVQTVQHADPGLKK